MVKSWEEYYNDPEIINEHPTLREIHAIRLMIHDERKGMTLEEKLAYTNAARFMCSKPEHPPSAR